MSKIQLAYVLPEYDPGTATHFAHLYDLLEAVAGDIDIHLVVERGAAPAGSFASVTVLERSGLARLFEEYKLLKKLRIAGCSKFYTHYSFTGAIAAGLVCRSSNATSYYWNCGMPWLFTGRLAWRNVGSWLANRLPLILALRLSTYCVTGTVGMARMYSPEYGVANRKFRVLPNWISLQRFGSPKPAAIRSEQGIADDVPIATYVHRVSTRKGADLLVPIVQQIKNLETVVVVAGGGPYLQQLRREVAAAGLESRFRLLGSVPNASVPSLLAASDIFLMPSLEEGFPRVLLEAMACGVPFVATDVGGVPEVVPPGSPVVRTGDVGAIAAAVDELIANPPRRIELAVAGREWVQRYDLPVVAREFISLLQS